MNVISCFDNQGNHLEKGTLINGNGTVNYYDGDGNLTKTRTFKDGVLVEK
ncbi:hypothetical protein [Aureivirga sp. CE67]|nr:hypothetical protein [Aureivirga sp. CE67]